MTVYRRTPGEEHWHWHPECPHFPTEQPIMARYVEDGRRPTDGALCPECLRLERAAEEAPADTTESNTNTP